MSPSSRACRFAMMATLLAATCPRSAWAEPDDTARAARLFDEAMSLAAAGQFKEACPKFEESQRLDPGLGTQFNLALCFEKEGRLGSAWRTYASVKRLAHETGKEGPEDSARQKMKELRPRVPYLVLSASTTDPDVTLKVDGQRVERETWSFYAIDRGEHLVEATAPAKEPWQQVVTVPEATEDPTGVELEVQVPPLVLTKARVVTVTKETPNTRRTVGYALGVVGVAGIGAAVVSGIVILHDYAVAKDDCTVKDGDVYKCKDTSARDAISNGKTLIAVNYAAWGVGLVGLGVGSYLLLTSGPKKPPAAVVTPIVGPSAGGVSVVGRF